MKNPEIYFACSIRGGRGDADIYGQLIRHISTQAIVLSEIFADKQLTPQGSAGPSGQIYDRDMAWVRQASGVIAEVTNPSLGVGYEIAKAEQFNKPVLALFREDGEHRLSAMIDGSPHITVTTYKTIDDAKLAIDGFVAQLTIEPFEK